MKKYLIGIIKNYYQKFRISFYRHLSTNKNIIGIPRVIQPAQFVGDGDISFGEKVCIGYFPSPYFFSGYAYFEARHSSSEIKVGDRVVFNNNFVCIAEREILIGNDVLIGTQVEILDTDGHNIFPEKRNDGSHAIASIKIGNNVWLGSNVKILKGVTIGENSVISNGSIVTKDIPENVIAGGVPARVIKKIENDKK